MTDKIPGAVEILQLEADEDAASVRDRLAFLHGQRVLIVWPEAGSTLRRKLDLVLIQREALRNHVQIALVTHDTQVTQQARELDISAFETLREGERARRWRRGRARNFATRLKRLTPLDPEALLPPMGHSPLEPLTPLQRGLHLALRAAVLVLLIAGVGAVAWLIVPSARVSFALQQTWISVDVAVTADPTREQATLDVENAIIPAASVRAELEERGTLPTTGTRTLSSIPAAGTVSLVNRTADAIDVPAGTLVSTSASTPIVFRTTRDVLVPAGIDSQAEAAVEAIPESAGMVGNVEAGLINTLIGPQADSLTVRNLSPTSGGLASETRVVTQADHDRLLAMLRQQLQERAFRELGTRTAETQIMIPETVRIDEERSDWKTYDHAVGDDAEQVTLTMRAIVAMTTVESALAQSIAYTRLGAQVQALQAQGESTINPNTLTYTRSAPTQIFANGTVIFDMNVRALASSQVDIPALQTALAGKTVEEAAAMLVALEHAPETTPHLELSPAWWGRLPVLSSRITIEPLTSLISEDALPQAAS